MSENSFLLTASKKEITDMSSYISSAHVFWCCKYHLVWTPKYRDKILTGAVGKKLYRSVYILCNMKDCEALELNVQPDHVHLVVMLPPKVSISTLMGVLKGRTAIRLTISFRIYERSSGVIIFGRGDTLQTQLE